MNPVRDLAFGLVAGLISAICPLSIQAISPINQEGVLCRGSYVILGRVLAAGYREPKNTLHFKVYVTEFLSRANSYQSSRPGRELRLGEVVDVWAIKGEEEPSYIANNTVLSNEQLVSTYVQKEFIFSIQMTDFQLKQASGPWVNFWRTDRKPWAQATLSLHVDGCPAPP